MASPSQCCNQQSAPAPTDPCSAGSKYPARLGRALSRRPRSLSHKSHTYITFLSSSCRAGTSPRPLSRAESPLSLDRLVDPNQRCLRHAFPPPPHLSPLYFCSFFSRHASMWVTHPSPLILWANTAASASGTGVSRGARAFRAEVRPRTPSSHPRALPILPPPPPQRGRRASIGALEPLPLLSLPKQKAPRATAKGGQTPRPAAPVGSSHRPSVLTVISRIGRLLHTRGVLAAPLSSPAFHLCSFRIARWGRSSPASWDITFGRLLL